MDVLPAECKNGKQGQLSEQSAHWSRRRCDTALVIVNWNSWAETIEALEAVFRMQDFQGPVVVCDNGSSDNSVAMVAAWAKGELCAVPQSSASEIRELVVPPVPRDFGFQCVTESEFQSLATLEVRQSSRLWIVECDQNKGFGAGSNVGITFLRSTFPQVEWFWLLNCDALPARDAYTKLRYSLPEHNRPVICGTVLREYSAPHLVQSCGASFNRLLCSAQDNMKWALASSLSEISDVMSADYPVGASIVVNEAFLSTVGLMSESYFLYFEELDWVMRAGWPSSAFIVTGSHVFHKGGATTSGGSTYRNRSLFADYYFLRNRIIFSVKFGRFGGVIATLASLVALFRRVTLLDRAALQNSMRALFDGFSIAFDSQRNTASK